MKLAIKNACVFSSEDEKSSSGNILIHGILINPEIIRLAYKCLSNRRSALITDPLETAGCTDGEYFIAENPCTVLNGKDLTPEGNVLLISQNNSQIDIERRCAV